MYVEQKSRSVFKTISWRVLATVTTMVIVYLFTGEFILAFSVGSVEIIAKFALYFFHERIWNKIRYGKRRIEPFVIWFTGLSGAGKSTLAEKTFTYLKSRDFQAEQLDGDIVRSVFPKTGFSKEERDAHINRVGFLASLLEKNGVIVVSAFISPYRETRDNIRKMCGKFIEVYVNAPLATCEGRDVKGLYKKARSGEIKHFTGIDDPYEAPVNPDIEVRTDQQSVDESFKIIKSHLDKLLR